MHGSCYRRERSCGPPFLPPFPGVASQLSRACISFLPLAGLELLSKQVPNPDRGLRSSGPGKLGCEACGPAAGPCRNSTHRLSGTGTRQVLIMYFVSHQTLDGCTGRIGITQAVTNSAQGVCDRWFLLIQSVKRGLINALMSAIPANLHVYD